MLIKSLISKLWGTVLISSKDILFDLNIEIKGAVLAASLFIIKVLFLKSFKEFIPEEFKVISAWGEDCKKALKRFISFPFDLSRIKLG